jgi:hypothetical protein
MSVVANIPSTIIHSSAISMNVKKNTILKLEFLK